jgi:hypothetical protein
MLQRLRLLRWFSLRSLLYMIFLGLSEWWMWAEAKAGCCTESLSANPKLRGVLADLPAVVAGATVCEQGLLPNAVK